MKFRLRKKILYYSIVVIMFIGMALAQVPIIVPNDIKDLSGKRVDEENK